jgi:hypothetical protein
MTASRWRYGHGRNRLNPGVNDRKYIGGVGSKGGKCRMRERYDRISSGSLPDPRKTRIRTVSSFHVREWRDYTLLIMAGVPGHCSCRSGVPCESCPATNFYPRPTHSVRSGPIDQGKMVPLTWCKPKRPCFIQLQRKISRAGGKVVLRTLGMGEAAGSIPAQSISFIFVIV